MNNETLRTFLAALGRALVETFGDQPAQAAPAPLPALVQEPVKAEPAPEDQPQRKVFSAKTFTCAVCGCRFEANAPHAKRCPKGSAWGFLHGAFNPCPSGPCGRLRWRRRLRSAPSC